MKAVAQKPDYASSHYNLGYAGGSTGTNRVEVTTLTFAINLGPTANEVEVALDELVGAKYAEGVDQPACRRRPRILIRRRALESN